MEALEDWAWKNFSLNDPNRRSIDIIYFKDAHEFKGEQQAF
jgi:hypothetical protein